MASPHFVRASAMCSGRNLQVCFKEAGLGANETVTITASGMATATYRCINRGGTNPEAGNKTTVVAVTTASGQFTSDRNGSVSGCLVLPVPSSGTFSCPPGQRLVLESVSFTNVQVVDETYGDSIRIPGTFAC